MAVHAGLAQVLGRKRCRSTKINGYKLLSQDLLSTFTVAVTKSKEYEAGLIPTVLPKTLRSSSSSSSLSGCQELGVLRKFMLDWPKWTSS